MIRINLAKARKGAAIKTGDAASSDVSESSAVDLKEIQKQGAIRLMIMILFPLGLYVYEGQVIPEKKQVVASKQRLLSDLKSKNEKAAGAVEEIKKFQADQARLSKQIETIETLRRERLIEVKILDALQREMPEKVWFTKLDFGEAKLTIQGFSVTDADLSLLMENLMKSVYVQEVNLIRSTEQPSEQGVLKKFEISATIDRGTRSQGAGGA